MMKHFDSKILLVIFLLASMRINAQNSLKDETRMPWTTATGNFIRDWLIIGGFPNQDGKGYDTDFLEEHNGELNIKPVLGMTHKLQNGSTLEWKNYTSPYNYVNFFDALKAIDYNMKVAYCYKKIQRPADGKAILSFGSNVGYKIWINGKLVSESKSEYQAAENYHVEVDMVKGENTILFKSVHGGWTWGFSLRIIEPDKFSLVQDFQLSPSIVTSGIKDNLIIKTDRTLNPEVQKFDITIKAVIAGGKVIAQKTAKRGEQISFDTKSWPNGVYDLCFTSNNNHGEIVTAYLYWYKGNAIEEAKKLVESIPQKPATQDEMVHFMLSEMIFDKVGKDLSKVDSSDIWKIYSPLMEYEELLLNKADKKGNVRANGFVRLAYRDEIDATPQFCRAYLPLNYDPNKKWPLVVNLHGYNGANPVYVKWWSVDQRHANVVDKYPVIYIEPHGRGNTSYNGIGDQDVLRCIELAKKLFNVDEDHVYLKGESMGGGGTWNVGTRHPELFAAIAPVYGGWDYHVGLDEQQLAKLTNIDRFYNERSSNFVHADAMLTTPIFVTHGDVDKSVDVANSRYGVKLLQRWGYDIRYHEYPGFGHEGIEYNDELIPWLLEHKRNADPQKVRVRSGDLKAACAHWVKITQSSDPYSFIEAEAEVLINNTIRLSTENVLALELSPSGKLIDPNKPVTVVWNVNDIREVNIKDGKICLAAKGYASSALNKNPKIEGPISDVTATPFAVVIGTSSSDSLMNKICQVKANEFINYWKQWQKYEPRVFKDTEISEADIKKYSLILLGGADANIITKKFGSKIPLKISSQEIEITGKKFPAKDACVQMVYPHPFNPERYVLVVGATSGAGMYFYNRENEHFDFIIQDGCIPNNYLGRPMDKLYIAKGMFNNSWQIKDELVEAGVPELRNACQVRKILPNLSTTVENLPKIDPAIYKALSGKYEIMSGVNFYVFVDVDKLMVKIPEGAVLQLFPASEMEYFMDVYDVQATFKKNENGTIDNAILHLTNRDVPIKKIE